MPISPIPNLSECDASHWIKINRLITECAEECGFDANLVSNEKVSHPIQKDIIYNLYSNPLVICDISCNNPNVLFELGLRLAFDKPTIIIKDKHTGFSFDFSAIRHLEYPRNLDYFEIQEFKSQLIEMIKATDKEYKERGENFSTYLKSFGDFKIAKLDVKEAPELVILKDEIESLKEIVLASVNAKGGKIRTYKSQLIPTLEDNLILKLRLKTGDISLIHKIYLDIDATLSKSSLASSLQYSYGIGGLASEIRFFLERKDIALKDACKLLIKQSINELADTFDCDYSIIEYH